MCVRVRPTSPTPWLEFHSSRTSSLGVKQKNRDYYFGKSSTSSSHYSPSLSSSSFCTLFSFIFHPTPSLLTFSPSCCVCLAAFPGRSPIRAPCFLWARISPVQCPISENETRESGYRNAPFPPDSLSITMMESYDDMFYCICRIFELTLEITHCTCPGPLSR